MYIERHALPSTMLEVRARTAEFDPDHALRDIVQRFTTVFRFAVMNGNLTVAGWVPQVGTTGDHVGPSLVGQDASLMAQDNDGDVTRD